MSPAPLRRITRIKDRHGVLVEFDREKIYRAISRSAIASRGLSEPSEIDTVTDEVIANVKREKLEDGEVFSTVEDLQDEIERQLMHHGLVDVARAFIAYRQERAFARGQGEAPDKVRQLARESSKYFDGNPLGEFVYLRTYAKWIEEENRRETWIETVDRYVSFMRENLREKFTEKEYAEIRESILKQEVMPSMRLLQFAGPAARRCNVMAYNCSFLAPKRIDDFGEVLYLSASGTGVGFSVETMCVQELPIVKRQTGKKLKTHVVGDSREAWAEALVKGMKAWYGGSDIDFDYSEVRPSGTRLKTTGGKASGPGPLKNLLDFTREKILGRQARRLTNLDVHDILCKIGEAIVSGGVRRTAMISLSDLEDTEMKEAKTGAFYLSHPHRSMSNNSAVYNSKPSSSEFLKEWASLVGSGAGERGIFNRGNLLKQLPIRRVEKWKEMGHVVDGELEALVGTNPCAEIILLPGQFCNLSEVIARHGDSADELKRKIRIATMIGTYQSTLVDFKQLSPEWRKNCEEERLLGVSITGQWDCVAARDPKVLAELKDEAVRVNKTYAKRFGVNQSTAVTAVKPSGTVSQTVNCSSGMHPRHSEYYIRRIRISATDSLFKMLKDQGAPYSPEVGQTLEEATTFVIDFPVKSPRGSTYKDDITAIAQLEHWKKVKENYTEHNPSVTVSVGDNEWIEVADWVYKNWDIVGGLSFLPRSNHVYALAPYEEITKEQYEELVERFKGVDYSKLVTYELQDETEMRKELACAGGTCEIM